MTFSKRVKDELLVQDILSDTAKVELMAVFKAIATIQMSETNISLELKSTHIKLIKRVLEIIKHEYPEITQQTLIRETRRFKEQVKVYILRLTTNVQKMLYDLNFIDDINTRFIFEFRDVTKYLVTTEQKRAYTKMFFCCSGTINDPKLAKQYHLEITSQNKLYLECLKNIVNDYEINMKISKRKNNYALYLNKSEEIADFLKYIHSFDTLFEFENYRLTRDIILMNNRLNNADIANEVKRLNTATKNIEEINLLKSKGIFETLKTKTKEVCILREKYPEDSLSELSEKSNGTISKANISYHLKIVSKKSSEIETPPSI